MSDIRSLCDALLETQKPEDQCTNFLLWILRKLPVQCLEEVCRTSGFLLEGISNEYGFTAQWPLENSCPDGLIQLTHEKSLIIETKRFANALDRTQFENHITGAGKKLGLSNCCFLFISGDRHKPADLAELRSKYAVQIGFISWKTLMNLFADLKQKLQKPYSILLDEFLVFARYRQLGKLLDMNADETKAFLAAYPTINQFQEVAQERFSKVIGDITQRVICNCEERVTVADELEEKLPCPYRSLKIKGWHVPLSAFIFVDILTKGIGLIENGYQSQKEKQEFLPLWNGQFKQIFRDNSRLHGFTWVDKGEDSNNAAYFKQVPGTSGKLFDPGIVDDFKNYFYWGYSYPLDVDTLGERLYEQIAADAKELVTSFTPKKFRRVIKQS